MRRFVWLGAAVLLLLAGAIYGLRGTAPPERMTASKPAATAPTPPTPAPPPAPKVETAKPPSFDVVTVTPQGQAVIAGRGAPGDHIRVFDGDKTVGEVTADARGEWVVVPNAPITPGDHQVGVEATGRDGGPVRRSGDTVALSVKPPSGAPNVAVLVPEDANKPAERLDGAGGKGSLSLDTARSDTDRLALAGHADPGARLNVYAGERLLGTATADSSGKWTLTAPTGTIPNGVELRLDQLAANGKVVKRVAAPFEAPPSALAGAAPTGKSRTYIVRHGNSLWLIARQLYSDGVRYTAIYDANRDQIRNPELIYPGQQLRLPHS